MTLVACGLTPQNVLSLPVMPQLTQVDLSDNPLTQLAEARHKEEESYWLAFAPQATHLRLRGCELHIIPPLAAARHLAALDVSCNSIRSVDNLEACYSTLACLDLSFNNFTTASQLRPLSLVSALEALTLAPNPYTLTRSSQAVLVQVASMLPHLLTLDDRATPASALRKRSVSPNPSTTFSSLRSSSAAQHGLPVTLQRSAVSRARSPGTTLRGGGDTGNFGATHSVRSMSAGASGRLSLSALRTSRLTEHAASGGMRASKRVASVRRGGPSTDVQPPTSPTAERVQNASKMGRPSVPPLVATQVSRSTRTAGALWEAHGGLPSSTGARGISGSVQPHSVPLTTMSQPTHTNQGAGGDASNAWPSSGGLGLFVTNESQVEPAGDTALAHEGSLHARGETRAHTAARTSGERHARLHHPATVAAAPWHTVSPLAAAQAPGQQRGAPPATVLTHGGEEETAADRRSATSVLPRTSSSSATHSWRPAMLHHAERGSSAPVFNTDVTQPAPSVHAPHVEAPRAADAGISLAARTHVPSAEAADSSRAAQPDEHRERTAIAQLQSHQLHTLTLLAAVR
ncbi:MAG: hypothetical protein EOO41_02405, partial [Methanobacteriota archaeon]